MAVYKRGYRRYRGPLTGRWTRFLVLPRYAWRRLYQQRLVLLLTMLAFVWPVLCAGFVYLTNHVELLQGLEPEFRQFIQVNGQFFAVFMYVQAGFAVFLAALAGPGLIAPDLANNALPLYFSRPLTRWSYALSRLTVLIGMLSVVTWIPGLLLFGLQVGLAGGWWFRANWTLGAGMVAGFLLWLLVLSLVAMASSAYVKWRVVAAAVSLASLDMLLRVCFVPGCALRIVRDDLRVDAVLQRGDDVAAVGVVLGVGGVDHQDVQLHPDGKSADLDVLFLHYIEQAHLDPRREVGKLVDGEDPAVGAGDDPEVDHLLVRVGELARGGLDRVDVADEVRDGDVRGGELLPVARVPRHPLDRRRVAALLPPAPFPSCSRGPADRRWSPSPRSPAPARRGTG